MARSFNELKEKMMARMTPEQRVEHEERLARDIAQIELSRMRQARELSQVALAAKLGTDQGSISRLERQGDMYLSTLRSYVEGVGGRLELRAVFPGQTMTLKLSESLK